MKSSFRRRVAVYSQELKKEFLYLFSADKPKRLLFDHLPKCGGTSLNKYLEKHYRRRRTFSTDGTDAKASIEAFKNLPEARRYDFELIKGHYSRELFEYVHPECFKITVLREPIDRIVSHYYYAKRSPNHYLHSKIHESNMSLKEYVKSGLSSELRNWYTTYFAGLTIDEAEKHPDESLETAIRILQTQYDLVGFLDNFSSFSNALRKQANLWNVYQDEKLNVTQGRISVETIEPATIHEIERVNHLDIALYNRLRTLAQE